MKALHPTPRFIGAAVALAATAVLAAAPAYAQQPEYTQQQSDERSLTRAEVNAQTLAAMQNGEITSGEATAPEKQPVPSSTRSREERKAETLQARRNGELPVGGNGTYKSSLSQQTATANSTKTRAERKAETMQAIRSHQTMQPGEAA